MMAMRNSVVASVHQRVSTSGTGNLSRRRNFPYRRSAIRDAGIVAQGWCCDGTQRFPNPGPRDNTPEHKTSERQTLQRATLVRVSGVVYIALLLATNNANEHTNGVISQSGSKNVAHRDWYKPAAT